MLNEIEETTHKNKPPAIAVKNMSFYYGKVQALKKVNLKVKTNQILSLIGPSGCGKSTFLRSLNRMNERIENTRIEGKVEYHGLDIYKDFNVIELRRRIGMVFQVPYPFPMSIFENVAFGPRVHGIKNKEELAKIVEDSLKHAALWDEVKDRMQDSALGLSGGQQQRLCIARTLAVKPEIILMDEPTSALDPASSMRIESLLEELKKEYTIIIVTHNMHQAGRVSDTAAFFLTGELVEYGDTADIFFKPEDERTEAYINGRFG